MPLQVKRLKGGKVLSVRSSGPADLREWDELRHQEFRVSGTPASRIALFVDARGRESVPSAQEARSEALLCALWRAVAILAKPGAQFGVARMIQAVAEYDGTPVGCFTDPDEAWAWLEETLGETLEESADPV